MTWQCGNTKHLLAHQSEWRCLWQGYSKSHSDGLILGRVLQEEREINFLASLSKGMLIQYRPGYTHTVGAGGCFLRGLTPFMLFREITFQKCHRRGRQDNQSREHTTRPALVCWLCLSAGAINQRVCCQRVQHELQRNIKQWYSLAPRSAALSLWLCTGARQSDRGQIMLGDLLCASL